ncbi:MAG: ATP-binding protein [Natronospirillum sp.]
MTDSAQIKDIQTVHATGFPWLSTVVAIVLIAWYWLHLDPALSGVLRALMQQIPTEYQGYRTGYTYPLLATLYGLCLSFDLRRYLSRRRQQKAATQRLTTENQDLWQQRRQWQMKARTYSGHADKLKLFISDKLLEYIEYDEKFLHFQSIAAEVRHNGVIAFDTVQSALKQADIDRKTTAPDDRSATYQQATEQMRYLWDLLDLATTDNLAMHIGNLQVQCEERYYQRLLNPNDPEPQAADYPPRAAVWRAVRPLLQADTLSEEWVETVLTESPVVVHTDPTIRLSLQPTATLLGKPSHLVLLLDNLLKNAQFYAHKRPYQHKHNRVAVNLTEIDGQVYVRVYNRGPHIANEEQAQIFQLGYSTRRVKEHHGKGLGLFFVHEIVKGYDGRIQVHNIDNTADVWHLRITLRNGDVINETVATVLAQGQCWVNQPEEESGDYQPTVAKTFTRSLRQPVTTIEVHQVSTNEVHTLTANLADQSTTWFDPFQTLAPRWAIELHPRKRGCRLVFEPLDVRGVEFEVRLPTAEARLNSTEDSLDLEDIDDEVARLNEPFVAQKPDTANSS